MVEYQELYIEMAPSETDHAQNARNMREKFTSLRCIKLVAGYLLKTNARPRHRSDRIA